MLIYTLMPIYRMTSHMPRHMPVNDMITETSATKNNLSRNSLIWPSACFVSSNKV